jgi:hypothetical protein
MRRRLAEPHSIRDPLRPGRAAFGALVVLLMAGFCAIPGARAADVTSLDQNDPMTWLVKSVCTNARDRVLPVDPYGGCPAGAGIRKIAPGDPLPYHNIDQIGVQQRDAFPVVDPIDGNTWIVATYDFAPFNRFNLYDGSDGYDIYRVYAGWASIVNTSDGGGFGQAFFASACTLGNAWILFPSQGFASGGQYIMAIEDNYWEQSAENYAGPCPTTYSTNAQTLWHLWGQFGFGGVDGNPVKAMETLASYHGFIATPGFLKNGHMEVNYFTREYGITRWEVWTPTRQHPTPTADCLVPPTVSYQGVTFVIQDCRDWSNPTPAKAPRIPTWPIPNINLLTNPHFAGGAGWTALGALNWATAVSKATRDTAYGPGVAYLTLGCAAACNGFTQALYQEIPVASLVSGTYGFGINARSEAEGGAATTGTIGVALEQLDARGRVLWSDRKKATVATDNGSAPGPGEAQSVYLSTAFVGKVTTITLDRRAVALRFLIAPQTPQAFDVLDAWFAPWPAPTAGFGKL